MKKIFNRIKELVGFNQNKSLQNPPPQVYQDFQLDRYKDRILLEQDRILFEEAVVAAEGGALRASYVMLWISCAEGIKRKFKELSLKDSKAHKIITAIVDMEAKHQSIDGFLIEKAIEYGFLNDLEKAQLFHIYQMRCVYGHPYENKPSFEEITSAARIVTDVVLSRPTKLREGYISEQATLLTEDLSFLDDLEENVNKYASEVQVKIADDCHHFLINKLWKKSNPYALDKSILARRIVWFSKAYLLCIPNIFPKWDIINLLVLYPQIATAVLSNPSLFGLLNDHAKDIVIGKLVEIGTSNGVFLRYLDYLAEKESLNERQFERFKTALKEIPLELLVSSGIRFITFIEKIIENLKSHDWYTQNPTIDILRNFGSDGIGLLPDETQFILGNNVFQVANGGSRSAQRFLSEIAGATITWPENFINGLLTECFVNEENQIRFKEENSGIAIRCLMAVSKPTRLKIVEQIVMKIKGGTLKPGFRDTTKVDKERMLYFLSNARAENPSELNDLLQIENVVGSITVNEF